MDILEFAPPPPQITTTPKNSKLASADGVHLRILTGVFPRS